MSLVQELDRAAAVIKERVGDEAPLVGVILGSGLGAYADELADSTAVPYGDLPGFPVSKVEIALKALFPETDFPAETLPGYKGGRRIENPWPLPDRVPLPIPAVETACLSGLEITTLQFGSGQAKGVLTGKLSRLARMGMGTIQTMPARAALAIRVSIPALIRSFIPGIEKIVPHEIIGSGSVEHNRLTFRFTSDRN